ncbi:phosphatidylinositol-specific phospholipase C domain-containing protein [Mycoplasma sp. Ms02]|uniref:phosphatidylinositol-specific phospholipase C domain-containing protein n=1 Tax=Mycoplasma sp. Ms02 TaxID=353851 RepID=UPI001C89BC45|nr:phosphatidylinositol-specific phospholipase C domain-containing protein [Mycoplasma sp. Ms02]QZE12359.1 phosphatidylinositol-specific phospholipase C domain-containing protein [Mycoplasma sp. Ms02]
MNKKIKNAVIGSTVILATTLPFIGISAALPQQPVDWKDNSKAFSDSSSTRINMNDWMSFVDGRKRLNELSIPGTHDTAMFDGAWAAYTFGQAWAKSQSLNYTNQLQQGIRFFDMRLGFTDDLWLRHGAAWSTTTFEQAMNDVKNFINAHPREVVFVRIKDENESVSSMSRSNQQRWGNTVRSVLSKFESYLYKSPSGENGYYGGNPTLDEMRGKIFIFNNFHHLVYPDTRYGMSYGALFKQDEYNSSQSRKLQVLKEYNDAAKEHGSDGPALLNFISRANGERIWYTANPLNPAYHKMLMDNEDRWDYLGFQPMDYPGDSLVLSILRKNYTYTQREIDRGLHGRPVSAVPVTKIEDFTNKIELTQSMQGFKLEIIDLSNNRTLLKTDINSNSQTIQLGRFFRLGERIKLIFYRETPTNIYYPTPKRFHVVQKEFTVAQNSQYVTALTRAKSDYETYRNKMTRSNLDVYISHKLNELIINKANQYLNEPAEQDRLNWSTLIARQRNSYPTYMDLLRTSYQNLNTKKQELNSINLEEAKYSYLTEEEKKALKSTLFAKAKQQVDLSPVVTNIPPQVAEFNKHIELVDFFKEKVVSATDYKALFDQKVAELRLREDNIDFSNEQTSFDLEIVNWQNKVKDAINGIANNDLGDIKTSMDQINQRKQEIIDSLSLLKLQNDNRELRQRLSAVKRELDNLISDKNYIFSDDSIKQGYDALRNSISQRLQNQEILQEQEVRNFETQKSQKIASLNGTRNLETLKQQINQTNNVVQRIKDSSFELAQTKDSISKAREQLTFMSQLSALASDIQAQISSAQGYESERIFEHYPAKEMLNSAKRSAQDKFENTALNDDNVSVLTQLKTELTSTNQAYLEYKRELQEAKDQLKARVRTSLTSLNSGQKTNIDSEIDNALTKDVLSVLDRKYTDLNEKMSQSKAYMSNDLLQRAISKSTKEAFYATNYAQLKSNFDSTRSYLSSTSTLDASEVQQRIDQLERSKNELNGLEKVAQSIQFINAKQITQIQKGLFVALFDQTPFKTISEIQQKATEFETKFISFKNYAQSLSKETHVYKLAQPGLKSIYDASEQKAKNVVDGNESISYEQLVSLHAELKEAYDNLDGQAVVYEFNQTLEALVALNEETKTSTKQWVLTQAGAKTAVTNLLNDLRNKNQKILDLKSLISEAQSLVGTETYSSAKPEARTAFDQALTKAKNSESYKITNYTGQDLKTSVVVDLFNNLQDAIDNLKNENNKKEQALAKISGLILVKDTNARAEDRLSFFQNKINALSATAPRSDYQAVVDSAFEKEKALANQQIDSLSLVSRLKKNEFIELIDGISTTSFDVNGIQEVLKSSQEIQTQKAALLKQITDLSLLNPEHKKVYKEALIQTNVERLSELVDRAINLDQTIGQLNVALEEAKELQGSPKFNSAPKDLRSQYISTIQEATELAKNNKEIATAYPENRDMIQRLRQMMGNVVDQDEGLKEAKAIATEVVIRFENISEDQKQAALDIIKKQSIKTNVENVKEAAMQYDKAVGEAKATLEEVKNAMHDTNFKFADNKKKERIDSVIQELNRDSTTLLPTEDFAIKQEIVEKINTLKVDQENLNGITNKKILDNIINDIVDLEFLESSEKEAQKNLFDSFESFEIETATNAKDQYVEINQSRSTIYKLVDQLRENFSDSKYSEIQEAQKTLESTMLENSFYFEAPRLIKAVKELNAFEASYLDLDINTSDFEQAQNEINQMIDEALSANSQLSSSSTITKIDQKVSELKSAFVSNLMRQKAVSRLAGKLFHAKDAQIQRNNLNDRTLESLDSDELLIPILKNISQEISISKSNLSRLKAHRNSLRNKLFISILDKYINNSIISEEAPEVQPEPTPETPKEPENTNPTTPETPKEPENTNPTTPETPKEPEVRPEEPKQQENNDKPVTPEQPEVKPESDEKEEQPTPSKSWIAWLVSGISASLIAAGAAAWFFFFKKK